MTKTIATPAVLLLARENGYDPIEDRLRANIRTTIAAIFEEELEGIPGCCRYSRSPDFRYFFRLALNRIFPKKVIEWQLWAVNTKRTAPTGWFIFQSPPHLQIKLLATHPYR